MLARLLVDRENCRRGRQRTRALAIVVSKLGSSARTLLACSADCGRIRLQREKREIFEVKQADAMRAAAAAATATATASTHQDTPKMGKEYARCYNLKILILSTKKQSSISSYLVAALAHKRCRAFRRSSSRRVGNAAASKMDSKRASASKLISGATRWRPPTFTHSPLSLQFEVANVEGCAAASSLTSRIDRADGS